MPNRYLIMQTLPADSGGDVADQLEAQLAAQGSCARVSVEAVTTPQALVENTTQALITAARTVIAQKEDFVLIDALESAPLSSFDVLGWNLDLAATLRAHIIWVPNVEGIPADLLNQDLNNLQVRATAHATHISAVAVPAAVAQQLKPETLVLSLPITPAGAASLEGAPRSHATSPLAFQADVFARARANRQRIVLPEPDDDRVLRAAAEVVQQRIADIILVGDKAAIDRRAQELGIDVSGTTIVSLDDAEKVERYAAEFARLRQKKGVTLEQAREQMKDVTYFATMMVKMGDADGMVSGASHTTADTVRPALQIIKTTPETSLVSSLFFLLLPDRVWAFGDCAVNITPTPEQIAEIAATSAQTARQFGLDPKVALLSYSTGSSGSGPAVEATKAAVEIAKRESPSEKIDGPLQFDAAVDQIVALKKMPESAVAGHANVFIFPNLEAGNIAYKVAQRGAGAVAVGPVLQGLNQPVNDLSRGALETDIVNTIAITAVQAQG